MVAHPDQGALHTPQMPPTHRAHPTERLWHMDTGSFAGPLQVGSHEYTLAHVSDIQDFQSTRLDSCITTVPAAGDIHRGLKQLS